MTTITETLTDWQQDAALQLVANWVGRENGTGPAPTGEAAYASARGPMLVREWDWGTEPRPTIIMEGNIHEWAIWASADTLLVTALRACGVYAEPYSSWALCLYPLPQPVTWPEAA